MNKGASSDPAHTLCAFGMPDQKSCNDQGQQDHHNSLKYAENYRPGGNTHGVDHGYGGAN